MTDRFYVGWVFMTYRYPTWKTFSDCGQRMLARGDNPHSMPPWLAQYDFKKSWMNTNVSRLTDACPVQKQAIADLTTLLMDSKIVNGRKKQELPTGHN
ncbi:MAG: hypothetical protein AAF564_12400 [Bacteroidota bacterium]